MNFTLARNAYLPIGIRSTLTSEDGAHVYQTLEHAYDDASLAAPGEKWVPKLPPGTYTCRQGNHNLHSGPIVAYEILGVPGHSGVLIHPGNTEDASEGCVLIGKVETATGVGQSRAAFDEFMALQAGADFTLTVKA